ncbi:3'-N-debenzoyl-2'-deoxytaxol N-benzoyltransferase-like protein [Quillaja saponaria]|uniref:3'-N-debenzoyl-2'-deoxytaxol N-benzoyltransferase-like protein n=1 Tax=Quillaja saponaria TaxID=32244 RepID=A0AAD7Q1H4_QUISA|nr:3'-N-debenzoyl-2'-deoxytaxol N-benzoyltransferase-like protein [Quillaja saponaria]
MKTASNTLSVNILKRGLVRPFDQTPSTILDLSFIDCLPLFRINVKTLHVFKHGPPEATKVIRQALSKALVHYYPLAGRLKESNQGYLQVECSGGRDGVWFVEAFSDCTLDSVNYLDDISKSSSNNLLPAETDIDSVVQMQVTQFACGGFVIGFIFSHIIFDGTGAAQFLSTIGELARNVENPSIIPVWQRDFFQTSLQKSNIAASLPSPPMPSNKRLEQANFDIPLGKIQQLKQEFLRVSGGNICSTFEIVVALCWRSRTRAIINYLNKSNTTLVKLGFAVNCRNLLNPPLPKGFYGNCAFPMTITAPWESLVQASIIDVVKMIQEAKAKLPHEAAKYFKGDYLNDSENEPFSNLHDYTALTIAAWVRLGFNQVDYGWGPAHPSCPHTRCHHNAIWHYGIASFA